MPPPPPTIPATWNDFAHRTPIHVLKRGVWENKGEPVGPRPPSVLVADDLPELASDIRDPRTRLARWLASSGSSPDRAGDRQPALAAPFRHGAGRRRSTTSGRGASRRAIRNCSTGWRRAGRARLAAQADPPPDRPEPHVPAVEPQPGRGRGRGDDPEDRLLWRFMRRRLEAEEIRDAMLTVSGRLNSRVRRPERDGARRPGDVQLLYKPVAMAGLQGLERARSTLHLPDRQTEPAAAIPGDVRRPGAVDQLPATRVEHPCAAGAGAAQRPAGERPGGGLRRAGSGRRPAANRDAWSPAPTGWPWDGRPTPAEHAASLAFLRDQPLENSPWPSSTSTGSSMSPDPCPRDLGAALRPWEGEAPALPDSCSPHAHARPTRTRREFIRDGLLRLRRPGPRLAPPPGTGPRRRRGRPAGTAAAPSRRQGTVRDLPVHGGRPQPPRDVRPQAAAEPARTGSPGPRSSARPSISSSEGRQAARHPAHASGNTARAGSRSPTCSRTSPAASTTSP